ncbi:MAG TPA: HupE/UreJ family protein [Burkholderiales bacterium]|nr:HupE/UreJ family protein [Burkholderiales bacterium]
MNIAARMVVGFVGLTASGSALAHAGAHPGGGWAAGFAHPFLGLDHLLAMVAVGVWAAQQGGRYLLLLPSTFVAAMAAGAVAAAYGAGLPQVGGLLALSVLALGILVALAVKTSWHWPVALVALIAMVHGHAHGAEMPELSSPGLYFAGFLAATAALHALGTAAGTVLKTRPGILRYGGAAIGLAGSGLLVTVIT